MQDRCVIDSQAPKVQIVGMAKAKDIMTANPLMLGSGLDLMEAVEFFNKHRVSSAPVQNPVGQILGQLTEMSLVKAVVHSRADNNFKKVIHAEAMFEPVTVVSDEDPIAVVLKSIVRSSTHRALVKDKKQKIVGIISPKDLLRSIQGTSSVGKVVSDEVKSLQLELGDLRRRVQDMTNYLTVYDTVFQLGLFGLHSIDKSGNIVFANARIHELLGYNPGDLIGKSMFDIYPESAHLEAKEGLKKVMNEGRHNLISAQMTKANGETVKVDIASAALKDEVGRFLGTFTISRAHGSPAMGHSSDAIFGLSGNKS